MVKHIGISFSPKGQSVPLIVDAMLRIATAIRAQGNAIVLVHCFAPREVLEEKGFSTHVVDALESIFPDQISCFEDGKPDREKMAEVLHAFNGEAYIIGPRIGGAAIEAALYRMKGITIHDVEILHAV